MNPLCWLFPEKNILKMKKIYFVCPTVTGVKLTLIALKFLLEVGFG